MDNGDVDYPWEEKLDIAFYRGQMTGADFDYHDAKLEKKAVNGTALFEKHRKDPSHFSRLEILVKSTENPKLIDAAYMGAYPGLKEIIP